MYKLHLDWLKITYISVSKSHPLFDRFAHVNTPVEATGDQVDLTIEEHKPNELFVIMVGYLPRQTGRSLKYRLS